MHGRDLRTGWLGNAAAGQEELWNVAQLNEFNRLFRQAASELGFSLFVAMEVSLARDAPGFRILCGEGFEGWTARYMKMRYAQHDCMLQELAVATAPFFWSDVLARREISLEARSMLDDAGGFGLHEGFLAPFHGPGDSLLAVMLAGAGCHGRDPHTRTAAHLLSTCYGMVGARIHRATQHGDRAAPLTSRQKDCLKWVRLGKSSTDIGSILGISAEVVDEHIQNACRRLGVRTRTQAAILVADRA